MLAFRAAFSETMVFLQNGSLDKNFLHDGGLPEGSTVCAGWGLEGRPVANVSWVTVWVVQVQLQLQGGAAGLGRERTSLMNLKDKPKL